MAKKPGPDLKRGEDPPETTVLIALARHFVGLKFRDHRGHWPELA
jgi:hypothetical protein